MSFFLLYFVYGANIIDACFFLHLIVSVEFPSSPSDYATTAAQSVIGQVLEGVQPLPEEARIPALTEAMTAFMEAWMEHILKQKIKFRYVYSIP